MKKLLIAIVLTAVTTFTFGQSKTVEDFRNKYKDDGAKVVSLSGGLFNLIASIASLEKNDEDIKTFARIAEGIESLDMIAIPVLKSGFDDRSLEQMRSELKNEKYEELMTVKEGGNRVYFFTQGGNLSEVKNMLVLIREEDQFMVLDIIGSLDMNDLAYLAKNHSTWH